MFGIGCVDDVVISVDDIVVVVVGIGMDELKLLLPSNDENRVDECEDGTFD